MKGCLGFLAFLVFLAAAVTVGVNLAAPTLAAAAIRGAGLRAASLDVTVGTSSPFELLLGRADRVDVEAAQVTLGGLTAGTLTASLAPVDLLAVSRADVRGTLTGAGVEGVPLGEVTFAGPLTGAAFAATVPPDAVRTLLSADAGVTAAEVSLDPPDAVSASIGGRTVGGRLVVSPDGRQLSIMGEALPDALLLVRLPTSSPIRIRSATVGTDGILVTGTLAIAIAVP